jgi:hypothetical protein
LLLLVDLGIGQFIVQIFEHADDDITEKNIINVVFLEKLSHYETMTKLFLVMKLEPDELEAVKVTV